MRFVAHAMAAVALLGLGLGGAAAEGFIGLKIADTPPQAGRGALIEDLAANGPGASAGLRRGDIVVAVDRMPITAAAQLSAYIRSRQAGDIATIELYRREGQMWRRLTVRVTLGAPSAAAPAASIGAHGPPPLPGAPVVAGGPPPLPAATGSGGPPPLSRAGGPPPLPQAAPLTVTWTKFIDPYEHAFVMEVPADWRVDGGIIPGDIVPGLRLTSSDGSLSMSLNDARLRGLFNVPVGLMGEQANPATHRYLPAPYFILEYGTSLVGEQCASPKLQRLRLRPDVATVIDELFTVRGGQTIAADAVYACERMGRPSLAYIALATHLSPNVGLQYWNVDTVEIAVAPPDRLSGSVTVMNRVWGSIEFLPLWLRLKGAQLQGQNAAAIRGLDAALHQSHLVDNIINGVGDFFNPATATTLQAPAGFDAYCQNGAGTIFGTREGGIVPNCQPLTPMH